MGRDNGNIFRGAVQGIKNAFNGVREFFSNLFNTIANIVKAPINFIIRGINAFIGALNRIQIPNWVPVVGGKGLNFPKIPELAKGGVLAKGQMGFLEGTGAEAVVPLEKNTEWISKVAGMFSKEVLGTLEKGKKAIKSLDSGLTKQAGSTHGMTSNVTTIYNQQTYDLKSEYKINDTSGKPESVAKAVDRTKQLQIRNLQGILNTP
jgi:hypothetical protein